MRVVIDGLPMRDDDNLNRVVSRLLQVWSQPAGGRDELHLVVGATPQVVIPDWVVVHRVKSDRCGAIGRRYARTVGVPRLCRSLKAHVLLGLGPTRRSTLLCCPRGTVLYDLWHQPGSEQFSGTALIELQSGIAWGRFARRLRLSMVDALAKRDWQVRRFRMRPLQLWSSPVVARAAISSGAFDTPAHAPPPRTLRPRSPSSRRSVRWIAAFSTSTLALSAAAAASVSLVASHNFPVSTPTHHATTPGVSHPATIGGGGSSTSPGFVPLPATTTTTSSTTSPTGSTLAPTSTAAATPPTIAGTSNPLPGVSIPGLTLPTVTPPATTAPSIPLPKFSCPTGSTTTTSTLSLLNLCDLNVGGFSQGAK